MHSRFRASLADQLKIEELWTHFEKIAEEKLPPSVPKFYKVGAVRGRVCWWFGVWLEVKLGGWMDVFFCWCSR